MKKYRWILNFVASVTIAVFWTSCGEKREVSAANTAYESIRPGMTLDEVMPHLKNLGRSLDGETGTKFKFEYSGGDFQNPVAQIVAGKDWEVRMTLNPDRTVKEVSKSGF